MRILSSLVLSAFVSVGLSVGFSVSPSICLAGQESDASDLARTAEIVNSYPTFGALIKGLEATGLVSPTEKTAITNFLFDRGVYPETQIEKTKLQNSALRWNELTLTQTEDGHLKNSNGQILKSEEKALEIAFGEAFLSFDKRSARAKVMDLFLHEARAENPLPNVARRASAAVGSMIYTALKASRLAGPSLNEAFSKSEK